MKAMRDLSHRRLYFVWSYPIHLYHWTYKTFLLQTQRKKRLVELRAMTRWHIQMAKKKKDSWAGTYT